MDQEEGKKEKEEVVVVKKITKHELDELKRLHSIADQAPNRVIGTINLRQEAKKNILDYHLALSKKYQFNPKKIGINRLTGDLQMIPKYMLKPNKKNDENLKEMLKKSYKESREKGKKDNVNK